MKTFMEDSDRSIVESLSRETRVSVDAVFKLYRHERDALARDARIPNYVPLLAARRVRNQLLHQPVT
jgi:hypothetical protein